MQTFLEDSSKTIAENYCAPRNLSKVRMYMIKITEVEKMVNHIIFQNEVLINLCSLINVLNSDTENQIEMSSCIIIPYYIQNNKRMELYQYEFCLSNEYNFESYILKKTGKENLKDVPKEILMLRQKCFAKIGEKNKVMEYLNFLLLDKNLKQEIENAFYKFEKSNLYLAIY